MKTYYIVEAFHDCGIFQVAIRESFEEAQNFLINHETHSWYGKGSGRINEYDQDMNLHKSYTFMKGVFDKGYDHDKKEPIRIVAIKQE